MNKNLHKLFVISSPSGGGKTSLLKAFFEDQKAKKMMLRMAMRSKEKQLGLESGYLVDTLYDMSSKERDVLSLVEEFNNLLEVLYTAAHRTAPEDQKSDKELGQMIKRFLENDPETVQLMYPHVNRLRRKLGV